MRKQISYLIKNKYKEAIQRIDNILEAHEGEEIEDLALFKQAELYTKVKEYVNAEENYLKIINTHEDSILIDNSYFRLAELYENELNDSEKSKRNVSKDHF